MFEKIILQGFDGSLSNLCLTDSINCATKMTNLASERCGTISDKEQSCCCTNRNNDDNLAEILVVLRQILRKIM